MGATKATLIVVGTVGGLGAVLAYSPPHHTASGSGMGSVPLGGVKKTPAAAQTPASEPTTPAPVATSAAPVSTPAPVKSTAPAKTTVPATKPSKKPVTKKTPSAPKLANGVFTGAAASAEHGGTVYGQVQVQVTLVNSKITYVVVVKAPTGPISDDINRTAVPELIQQTLAATTHVGDITGVSSASATSQGYYDSLVSAISKAGPTALSNAGL